MQLRWWKRVLGVVLAVGLSIVFIGLGRGNAGQQVNSAGDAKTTGYYLVIGASASQGMQPTGVVGHNGAYTATGYANDVVSEEAAKGVRLAMTQIGCPGETPESMLAESDNCYSTEGQMDIATTYLAARAGESGLVSIDLGFNNVRPCIETVVVDVACADQGIAAVARDLPDVLDVLKDSAGSQTRFVGLTYEDPFLGDYVRGGSSPAQAAITLSVMAELNQVLTKDYLAAGMAVAQVPDGFASQDTTLVTLPGVGVVPQNVANACQWTWFCSGPPWGPDDHPDNAGYQVIAEAITTALGKW
jgi:hypothetical protein